MDEVISAFNGVDARCDPSSNRARRAAVAAFGPFCDELRRLSCLTPTQALVGHLLAWATLRQGFVSLRFRSLDELTRVRPHARPFAGLGKNDLSPALNALMHFGIVRLDERAALESGLPEVSGVLVIADSAQWNIPASGWLFTRAEQEELLTHLLACRQRFTPQLPVVGGEADLHDARAAQAAESAAAKSIHDAPRRRPPRQPAPDVPCRSDFRNADSPANARCVPAFGTSRARAVGKEREGNGKLTPLTPQTESFGSVRWMKDRLADAEKDEAAFREVCLSIFGDVVWNKQPDGGKWMRRWWHMPSRPTVFRVLRDMIEVGISSTPGAQAQHSWTRFGGQSLDDARFKNVRRLLNIQ